MEGKTHEISWYTYHFRVHVVVIIIIIIIVVVVVVVIIIIIIIIIYNTPILGVVKTQEYYLATTSHKIRFE